MADPVDPKHLDKRTAERYLRSGQLDEKTYERHIKGLPDVTDKASTIETAMDDDIFDDDDDDVDGDEADSDDEEADESPEDTEAS
jgi:hypothetical protein